MENNTSSIFNFNMDEESRSLLSTISLWANINAIAGLVSAALTVSFFVVTLVRLSRLGGSASDLVGLMIIWPLISLMVSLAVNIILLQAASNIRKGIDTSSQEYFETGITKLAVYFRIVGIVTIVVIVFVVLAFLFSVLAMRGTGF